MASLDIGLDLGTATLVAGKRDEKNLVREASLVARDKRTKEILHIGNPVIPIEGREPENIEVIRPLSNGVISNYSMTCTVIKYMLEKVTKSHVLRPQIIASIPCDTTGVESQSVIDAAIEAGARSVYLVEEPVAAALGAGIDISRPYGCLVVDIGSGSTDAAVLSMNGVVGTSSTKTAGNTFNQVIMKYMRSKHNLLIGYSTAEEIKRAIGNVWYGKNDFFVVKGRGILTGLPTKIEVSGKEIHPVLRSVALQIGRCIQRTLELTPPELAGDIRTSGLLLTGGGALLSGMNHFLESYLRVPVIIAPDPMDCVLLGALKGFSHLDTVYNGILFSEIPAI